MVALVPELTLLSDLQLDCGETPVWDAAQRRLYWTDGAGQAVYSIRFDQAGTSMSVPVRTELFHAGIHVAAICLHAAGGLMAAGRDGFFHICPKDEKGVKDIRYFDRWCEGKPVEQVNELIADEAGRVIGGQEKFNDAGEYEPGYLFQLDTVGTMRIVEEGLHISNGMGFSPDGTLFYLTDSITREIYVYNYDLHSGRMTNRKTLVRLERSEGLPDGMSIDSEGCIWTACWFGALLRRYRPDGSLERTIQLPFAQPTSLCFGGEDLRDLFITSAAKRWESALAPVNHDFTSLRGGGLYHLKQDIKGRKAFKASV